MGDDYYRVESQKRQNKAAAKMLKYKHDHRQSFIFSGEDCRLILISIPYHPMILKLVLILVIYKLMNPEHIG